MSFNVAFVLHPSTEQDYEKANTLREIISQCFGDWEEVSRDETGDCVNVIWNFTEEGLGIHYGWVSIDEEGYYDDWSITHSHDDAAHQYCVEGWDEYENCLYLYPSGEWKRDPYWYTETRAKSMRSRHKDQADSVVVCRFFEIN